MPHTSGFSLVELSIVLVILGLLTGGILSGQSLIRASELRSVAADADRYRSSFLTFRDKYFQLPGDMTNAVKFWGRADTGAFTGECAAPQTDAGTGTQTCNGNGDGYAGLASACTGAYERFRAWEHLTNAGLIEGDYTGISHSSGCNVVRVGVNSPRSRMSNAGFGLIATANNNGHSFTFGADSTGPNMAAAIKPEEAWNIDTKMDDGKPVTGKVRSDTVAATPNCRDTDTTAAEYVLTQSGTTCSLYIGLGF